MVKRITERPVTTDFTVTESAANTYTEVQITLPVAIIGASKVQGVELMAIDFAETMPDAEPGQDNSLTSAIIRDSNTAIPDYGGANSDDLIWRRKRVYVGEDATAIEQNEVAVVTGTHKFTFTDNGDEKGLLLAERSIYAAIVGSGNATAKVWKGRIYYHIVELTAAEVVVQLALDDDI